MVYAVLSALLYTVRSMFAFEGPPCDSPCVHTCGCIGCIRAGVYVLYLVRHQGHSHTPYSHYRSLPPPVQVVSVGDTFTVTCLECKGRRAKFTRVPHLGPAPSGGRGGASGGSAGGGGARHGGEGGRVANRHSVAPPASGDVRQVVVKRIAEFGVFVDVLGEEGGEGGKAPTGHQGLIHNTQVKDESRIPLNTLRCSCCVGVYMWV